MSLKRQLCHSGAVMPLQGASYGLSVEDDTEALVEAASIIAIRKMKLVSKAVSLHSLVNKFEGMIAPDEPVYVQTKDGSQLKAGDVLAFPEYGNGQPSVVVSFDDGDTIEGVYEVKS